MSIRQQITEALKEAQKAQDRCSTATLRLVCAAMKDRDIAARSNGTSNPIGDDQILDLLAKMVRQREEAAEQFRAGDRTELADKEEAEIEVIRRFMPRRMSAEEMEATVDHIIGETEATGLKDMGRVMAALKQTYPGQIDGATASALVKQRLG
ncbi:MAG: glutamyl-tRNA amidotransferase [Rhodospirillaceae bacterium]|nr:glutamyl-tRNA amidotransferase [Rhodospirillaceae bacterium]|tara:strand:+ start:2417 stop:2875 length:459 start_codon:yes stop_codon:yes gene_type:complete